MFKLQEKLPRLIFWGHTEIFIIGSELAKEGIRSNIDFMVRHPEVRENAFIFISKKKAKRILEMIPPLERSSSEVLRGQVKSGIGVDVTLKGDEEAVNLPWVEEVRPAPGKKSLETSPYINGSAIIKEDKMVGHVNDKITSGVLWLRDEIHSLIITVSPEEAKGLVSLKLLKGHSQLIPKIENKQWKITLKIESESEIMQNGTNMALMNPKYTKKIEKDVEDEIQKSIQQALDKVQIKMKADVFDFADAFHRKYPKQWNKEKDRWDELFPEVKVSYDIKAKIRRPGMATVPAGLPKEEVRRK
jgi:spore germination protein KC